jgi:hypothetical protein
MPAKSKFKDYHVNFRLIADVAVRVSAATPEEAIAKCREVKAGELLDVDEYLDGSIDLRGVWTIDD